MALVDLHCHLLPGIDDGSPDLKTSLSLARQAVANGITHALLTPHHLNGHYLNHKPDVIQATQAFQVSLKQAHIPLTVFAGQEVRLSGQLLPALAADDLLFADESQHYLLLEFPSEDVPSYAHSVIFDLLAKGITPVIVHPERNARILKDPKVLQSLLEQGCLTQLTASSFVGTFGKKIQQLTTRLISAGQGATFASDAHALPNRQYELSQALAKLSHDFGDELAESYRQNARDILNGDTVQMNWQPLKRQHFWSLF